MDCIGLGQDREMGKLRCKRTLSKPRRKWDDIIEIDHQELGCGLIDCIGLEQNRDMVSLGGKSPLSRPRRKWDDIIEIFSQEFG